MTAKYKMSIYQFFLDVEPLRFFIKEVKILSQGQKQTMLSWNSLAAHIRSSQKHTTSKRHSSI